MEDPDDEINQVICNSKSHTNVEVAHRIEKGDIAITESLI